MDYLTLIVLIVFAFLFYGWLADSTNKRIAEEKRRKDSEISHEIMTQSRKKEEEAKRKENEAKNKEIEAGRQRKKESLKPMQNRIQIFLKTHPGETFCETELRKRLGIITASEDYSFQDCLSYASMRWDVDDRIPIEGVKVSFKDMQYSAYYVDPEK